MIPQLDGPGSLPIRDLTRGRMGRLPNQIEQDPSQGGTYVQKATAIRKRNTLKKQMVMMTIGDHIETKDPLIEEDTLMEVEDPLIEEDTLMEVEDPLIEGDTLIEMEDLLIEENNHVEDLLIEMEDPLEEDTLVEDPLMEEEDPLVPPEGKDHQAPQGPPGPVRSIIVQITQVTLDTSALENMHLIQWGSP